MFGYMTELDSVDISEEREVIAEGLLMHGQFLSRKLQKEMT